jgi:hypothetical protein
MADKPFREKGSAKGARSVSRSDKSEFEDKVHQEFGDLLDRFNQLQQKVLNPKPEKDEGADKYAKDYADINKATKDSKDAKEHKHEKAEKERKEFVKEVEVGGLPVAFDPAIDQRLAALESVVAHLAHFIPGAARPDLTKGALKDER